jgi:polyisoprenoid-binding protein YceI
MNLPRPCLSRFWTALCLALTALPLRAEPAVYDLDPDHTFVTFEFMHFGASTSRARLGPVRGAITVDRARGEGEIGVRIPTASVDTGLAFFNSRLRQADLLASEEFPEAFFVARRLRFEGGQLAEVRGEFTFRGVSQPLSLVATHFACRPDPQGEICGGDFEAEVLRSSFGATFGLPLVGDRVKLLIQVEGRRRS